VLIEALPPVLVVHLERFHDDAVAGGVVKNRKPVQFYPELEIPPGNVLLLPSPRPRADRGSVVSDIMVPTAGRPAMPTRYTLNGVLYHHGASASGGRYTVDVLHPNTHESSGEAWVRIDDEIVSTVGHEEVFGRHDCDGTDDRCAYLLFYRRTASTQT
jgi:ubiquitin carboxyl-terminal hydrolase 10